MSIQRLVWPLYVLAILLDSALAEEKTALRPAVPSYRRLSEGGWAPLPWCGRRFVFEQSYYSDFRTPGSPDRRAARETDIQKLLSTDWKDPDYIGTQDMPIIAEWSWSDMDKKWGGKTKRECYEKAKAWFLKERSKMLADPRWEKRFKDQKIPFASMTGHGWLVHNPAEWGVDWLGIEIGENIQATQLHIAFLRGAARMFQKPMFADVSQWHGGTVPDFITGYDEFTKPPCQQNEKWQDVRLHNGGHSSSVMARMWYVCWLSGIGSVCPEACLHTFFSHSVEHRKKYPGIWEGYDENTRMTLSPYGIRAKEFFAVTQKHPEIGIPYTPFAALLDEYSGFFGFHDRTGQPWGFLPIGPGDRQAFDFLNTMFPNTMRAGGTPEHERLAASTCGDTFDVLVTGVKDDLLRMYPVVIVLGEHEFLPETVAVLKSYVTRGGELYLTQSHADQLGSAFAEPKTAGRVHVYDSSTRESRERLLRQLEEQYVPVAVGGRVEYLTNRTPTGWVVGLLNNEGVVKDNMNPVCVDRAKDQTVTVRLKTSAIKSAVEWCSDRELPSQENAVSVAVPAGEVRIVEFIER